MSTRRNRESRDLLTGGATGARLLDALVVATAALVVFEVVLVNRQNGPRQDVVLFGPSTAGLLLMLAVLARIGRGEYAHSTRPVLRAVSRWAATSDRLTDAATRYRVVELTNVGQSVAIVAEVTWSAAAAGDVRRFVDVAGLREFLDRRGFADGRDYAIANYSPGTALGPHEVRTYFECTDGVVASIDVLEVTVRFVSLLGDSYQRAVPLLPQTGASEAVVRPSPRAVA